MTLVRRGSAKQKHAARRAWLAARAALTTGVPGINDDVSEAGSQALTTLCVNDGWPALASVDVAR